MKIIDNEIIQNMINSKEITSTQVLILEKTLDKNMIDGILENLYKKRFCKHNIFGESVVFEPKKVEIDNVSEYFPVGDYHAGLGIQTRIRLFYKNTPNEISINSLLHELMHHFHRLVIYHSDDEETLVSALAAVLTIEFADHKKRAEK